MEEENKAYIKRYQHVLNGYIEIEKKNENDDENENKNKKGGETNEENIEFLKDSKKDDKEEEEEENEIEIDIEKLSFVNNTKNILIKFFNFFMPFKNDIKFIKANYNTTVLLVFRIYRFLFLMSIFSAIIFLFLSIIHLIKVKNNLKQVCKYGFPCFLFYSSFTQFESQDISIAYGIWIIFYFICTMIYYFILNSEENKEEIYYQNSKIYPGCSYFFTSWNFNNKDQKIIETNKQAIKKELEEYAEEYLFKIDEEKENETETQCGCCYLFFAHLFYIAFLIFIFFLIIVFFFLRAKMRSNEITTKLEIKDIISDIIVYLLIGTFLYLVVWITGIFPICERWEKDRHQYLSESIKKLITSIVSMISLIYIITYFTLYGNEKKLIPFLDVDQPTFFGCPGKFEDHRHDVKLDDDFKENYDQISTKSYSQCREEDVGITFFFIFMAYFLFLFIKELLKSLLKCLCSCSCMEIPTYIPSVFIIHFFIANILYLMTMYYIPFFGILFPIVILIIYKFHFFILKRRGSFSFKETGINRRNNKNFILIIFIIFNIAVFCIIGLFYFSPVTHSYTVECYTPKSSTESFNILLYNTNNWCGPLKSKMQLSSIMTNKMKNTLFIGWIVNLFQQLPFIIILFSVFLIILIYRKYNPDKRYYEYIVNRQKELVNTFYSLYEQISKRDMITSMLLKITQQKLK